MTKKETMESCLACIEKYVLDGTITSRIGALNLMLGYYYDERNIPKELIITILDKYLYLD